MEANRVALELNAMNLLEAMYALDMMKEYITQKYLYSGREGEWIREKVYINDGDPEKFTK